MYGSPKPYQPVDRELSDDELARVKADTALILQETRLKKAQADAAEQSLKEGSMRTEREGLYLEGQKLSLGRQQMDLASYRRRDLVERHYHGDFGTFEFNREVKGDANGFFGFQPGTIEPLMAKLTAYAESNPEGDIKLIINSPGGGVTAGFRLFGKLRELSHRGHHITTVVSGMAASMGGVLVQAGDTRLMDAHAELMLHQASSGAWGPAYSIADTAERLNDMGKKIMDIFVDRARGKLTHAVIEEKWDRRDWWVPTSEAVERGLVDAVVYDGYQDPRLPSWS